MPPMNTAAANGPLPIISWRIVARLALRSPSGAAERHVDVPEHLVHKVGGVTRDPLFKVSGLVDLGDTGRFAVAGIAHLTGYQQHQRADGRVATEHERHRTRNTARASAATASAMAVTS